MTTAIRRISARLNINITIYPELAENQGNEDRNLTTRGRHILNYFE